MKLESHERVAYETAKARALSILLRETGKRELTPASWVAVSIWPGNRMTAQGAGAAASRILKRLEREGLARWTTRGSHWGWEITAQGRAMTATPSNVSAPSPSGEGASNSASEAH